MKKEELLKLAEKLGMNLAAVENHIKEDRKAAEEQITKGAKFMGLIK